MKKNLLKITALSLISASILFTTGCKPKDGEVTEEKQSSKKTEIIKEPVSVEEIPASGAKTFITTQAGASNFVKNISKNVDTDKLIEEAEGVININDITDQIEEIYDESKYAESLEETIEKIVDLVSNAIEGAMETGSIDINIEEKPGAATDFPAGYSLDIPRVLVKAKGSVNDINNPTAGSADAEVAASAKVSVDKITLEIPEISVNAKVNVTQDPIKQAVKADGNIGEKFALSYSMDGLSFKINALNNDIQVRGDYDGSKGSGTVKLNNNYSSELEFNAAKLGIPSSPVKYVKSIASVKGNLDGNPAMNSDQSFRGNINYDYEIASKTGISFAAADGTGGKLVADVKFNVKGSFNLAEIMQIKSIMFDLGSDLFTGMKLTEEEFKDKKLPFESVISLKFYDDNNKETLDFLNIKSAYELYSFIYDYASGMNEDDFEDLLYMFEDLMYEFKYLF